MKRARDKIKIIVDEIAYLREITPTTLMIRLFETDISSKMPEITSRELEIILRKLEEDEKVITSFGWGPYTKVNCGIPRIDYVFLTTEKFDEYYERLIGEKDEANGVLPQPASDEKPGETEDTGENQVVEKKNQENFRYSADFRSVKIGRESFALTPKQAHMIQLLYDEYINGTPDVSGDHIVERISPNSNNIRPRDIFRSNLKAWNALVEPGRRKGLYRLKI